MKEALLALMVLTAEATSIEEALKRCDDLKLTVCTFTIEEGPAPQPTPRKQCEKLRGEEETCLV